MCAYGLVRTGEAGRGPTVIRTWFHASLFSGIVSASNGASPERAFVLPAGAGGETVSCGLESLTPLSQPSQ